MFRNTLSDIPVTTPVEPLVPAGGYPKSRVAAVGEELVAPIYVARTPTGQKYYAMQGHAALSGVGLDAPGIPRVLLRKLTPGEVNYIKAQQLNVKRAYQYYLAEMRDVEMKERIKRRLEKEGKMIGEDLKRAIARERKEAKLARKKWKAEEKELQKILREYERMTLPEDIYQQF